MVRLRYAMLCDFAMPGERGKRSIVSIWDSVMQTGKTRPIPIPRCFLVGRFEASALDGSVQELEIHFVNDGGELVLPEALKVTLPFTVIGPDRPLVAQFQLELDGLTVPDVGDYEFNFRIAAEWKGTVELYVRDADEPPG